MVILLKEENASIITSTTSDGRIWGPFESLLAAIEWKAFCDKKPQNLVTAREVFEGSIDGDEYFHVSASALEDGMHPLYELYDIMIEHDNGKVVFDTHNGLKTLHPETPIFVISPFKSEQKRTLPLPVKAPERTDIDGRHYDAIPNMVRGEIIVLGPRHPESYWIVAWRPDKRKSKDLAVLSVHSNERYAVNAAKAKATSFSPPLRLKRKRARDIQREKVYNWESTLNCEVTHFTRLDECRAFLHDVCDQLGIAPPEISIGSSKLTLRSYYSALKGIILSTSMMDSETILHELVHHIRRNERSEAAHSREFAGMLAGVLTIFSGLDLDEALKQAKQLGVDIDEELAIDFISRFQIKPPTP